MMKLILLGTGTSTGVPEVGCGCLTCCSSDPRDTRLRTSALLISSEGKRILIDCGPDFRQQATRIGLDRIDAILLTHEHYDHVYGLDDLRTIAWRHKIPIYGQRAVLEAVKRRMHYVFSDNPYPGTPLLVLRELKADEELNFGELRVRPIVVQHGKLPIYAYRFHEGGKGAKGDICYITDMKSASAEEWLKVDGSSLLVINALRYRKEHPSHQSVLDVEARLGELSRPPQLSILTHLSHHAPAHTTLDAMLPERIRVGYDYMCIELRDDGSIGYKPFEAMQNPFEVVDLGLVDELEECNIVSTEFRSRLFLGISSDEGRLLARLMLDKTQYPCSLEKLRDAVSEAGYSLLGLYGSQSKSIHVVEGYESETHLILSLALAITGANSLQSLSGSSVRLDVAVIKAQLTAKLHKRLKVLMVNPFKGSLLSD